ncbi:DUF6731 family protein [Jeotgalibacillus soli]|uniref:Uncharacterized protein n=1 Tax=Jeotgalibacillus soli TaxID=889306 RepID=A0A0C2V9V9_9BACL|nr:DUF6731 family protein [Jeotgalibacillus soli]KIL45747.1 hypothetical protein KP78_20960 [Jeotgalibacillus soli]
MSRVKRIGFNFFRSITQNEEDRTVWLNLSEIFDHIIAQYQHARDNDTSEFKRVYTYNYEPARLSQINIDYNTQYYHLTFERLNYALPNRTTLHGDSEMLDLESDEFIGHEATVLYDPVNHILMIQRNRDSLGPTAIGAFIQSLVIDAGAARNSSIAMITDNTAQRRAFNQSAYRKVYTKIVGAKANGMIERLFGRNPNVDSIEISFNSRSVRDSEIDQDFTVGLLEEFINDPEVEKLRIRSREHEESPVEPIDLINHKLEASQTVDLRNDRQLNSYRVFEYMVELYNGENGGYRNRILRMD